jgi:hypothetical protein
VVEYGNEYNRNSFPGGEMNELRIVVDPNSIRAGRIGPATGDIWIEAGDLNFPMKGWNDFVVVILASWAQALVYLLRGGRQQEVYFMEGPYKVEIDASGTEGWSVTAVEQGLNRSERWHTGVQPLSLVESVLSCSASCLQRCRDIGCSSTDEEDLQQWMIALRNEIGDGR